MDFSFILKFTKNMLSRQIVRNKILISSFVNSLYNATQQQQQQKKKDPEMKISFIGILQSK